MATIFDYRDSDEKIFDILDLPLSTDDYIDIIFAMKMDFVDIRRGFVSSVLALKLAHAVLAIYPEWSNGEIIRVVAI